MVDFGNQYENPCPDNPWTDLKTTMRGHALLTEGAAAKEVDLVVGMLFTFSVSGYVVVASILRLIINNNRRVHHNDVKVRGFMLLLFFKKTSN